MSLALKWCAVAVLKLEFGLKDGAWKEMGKSERARRYMNESDWGLTFSVKRCDGTV